MEKELDELRKELTDLKVVVKGLTKTVKVLTQKDIDAQQFLATIEDIVARMEVPEEI